jgi:CubicO group peptidase (beta-lactamase class C family)
MIRGLAILLMLTVGASLEQTTATGLDAWVSRAMQTFEVPGLALAVVKDGGVVVAKGYGVRRLGDAAKVDERTLFGIASNTKAFTATALGLLVEEGKIECYLPSTGSCVPTPTSRLR